MGLTALDTTMASGRQSAPSFSRTLSSRWPTSTKAPPSLRLSSLSLSLMSDPVTSHPLAIASLAKFDSPEPPMPTKWTWFVCVCVFKVVRCSREEKIGVGSVLDR